MLLLLSDFLLLKRRIQATGRKVQIAYFYITTPPWDHLSAYQFRTMQSADSSGFPAKYLSLECKFNRK